MLYSVILAGGAGSRLWPLSRLDEPKQFIKTGTSGASSLFQESMVRNLIPECHQQIIVADQHHLPQVNKQLAELSLPAHVIAEAEANNTAAAVVSAAITCYQLSRDAMMVVSPSDHWVKDIEGYQQTIRNAIDAASEYNNYVLIGMPPKYPEADYGYIELNEGSIDALKIYHVDRFIEKPPLADAIAYVNDPHYLWNSGVFVIPVKRFLNEIAQIAPKGLEVLIQALRDAKKFKHVKLLPELDLQELKGMSIDQLFFENIRDLRAIRGEFGWSDLGNWDRFMDVMTSNHRIGDSSNCSFFSVNRKKIMAAVDVQDLMIVDTPDVLYITRPGKADKLKNMVKRLVADDSRYMYRDTRNRDKRNEIKEERKKYFNKKKSG
jgi:mannose-1-phosphate guanylyltransferase/mannose-6-phosphate isomerase